MNEYIVKVTFLDDEEYELENVIFKPIAKDTEDAYDQIEAEIEDNQELYPSDDFEFNLVDVC
jgi:hypothetical protein